MNKFEIIIRFYDSKFIKDQMGSDENFSIIHWNGDFHYEFVDMISKNLLNGPVEIEFENQYDSCNITYSCMLTCDYTEWSPYGDGNFIDVQSDNYIEMIEIKREYIKYGG